MKKAITLILALVMILSLAVPAAAATTDLTINDGSGYSSARTYEAYQIMKASVDGLNFSYSINDKYEGILTSVLGLTFAPDATAEHRRDTIVAAIAAFGSDAGEMRHFADNVYAAIKAAVPALTPDATWTGNTQTLEQGYWLIADVTDLSGTEYSNSLVMVDTVGDVDVTITNKPDIPITSKKTDDENDSLIGSTPTSEDETAWQDTADYDIGDAVPFEINVELPNNVAEYKYYSFIMKDTASKGLTYLPETFAITVNKESKVIKPSGTAGADFWYDIDTNSDGSHTLYVYPARDYVNHAGESKTASKTNGGDFIKLFPAGTEHSAISDSRITFTYKCELNENAVAGQEGNPNYYDLIYSNNPYDDGFGESPTDINLILTFKGVFNKVDTDGNALKGADFELYKFIAKFEKTDFADQAAMDAWAAANDPAHKYEYHNGANAWGYYEACTLKTKNADETTFTFNGLDDGYYKLSETVVPEGFNGIADIEFRIVAGHVTDITTAADVNLDLDAYTSIGGALTIVGTEIDGAVTADIENRSGTELPTTGGIGTTIFYVLGGVMVAGAAVLLVTKKRMAV